MLKEFSIVFCVMSWCLVEDIVMVALPQGSGQQPIGQWSGQINGFDTNQTNRIPGYGMGNGMNGANGNGGNGSNGSNGTNGSNGSGMGNGWNGWNGWNNGMRNGSNSSSGWNNGAWNNGMANGWNNGMSNGWNNGSNVNGGNGMGPSNGMMPSNVMGDEWGNGFSGMSWSNSTNSSFGSMQSQANKYPGGGYPSTYYEQFSSQSIIVPTPANVQDLQNTTAPSADSFTNQMNGGNMGNFNNPSGFQLQGCLPQSTGSTASPVTEGSTASPVTEGSTDTTESIETTQSTAESEDKGTTTVASTRKRTKH